MVGGGFESVKSGLVVRVYVKVVPESSYRASVLNSCSNSVELSVVYELLGTDILVFCKRGGVV